MPSGGAFFLFYAALLTVIAYGCFYFRGKYTDEKMSRQNQEVSHPEWTFGRRDAIDAMPYRLDAVEATPREYASRE